MDICGCSDPITNGKSQNLKDLKVSNAIFTRDLYASGNVYAYQYHGDGGLLSNITSGGFTQPLANLVVSNSVTTTNVFASGNVSAKYFVGDGGLLSNITSGFTQPLANLVVSNTVTTTNLAVSGTAYVIGNTGIGTAAPDYLLDVAGYMRTVGIVDSTLSVGTPGQFLTESGSGLLWSSDGGSLINIQSTSITQPFANLVVSNSVTTTNVFASYFIGDGSQLSNINSSNITQPFANLVVSNSVTTTNLNVSGDAFFSNSTGISHLINLNITPAFTTYIAYGSGYFVAVSKFGSSYSSDGNIWINPVTITDQLYTSVAYGDGYFVAVAQNGIAFSNDHGATWTDAASFTPYQTTSVIYGNGYFVAVSSDGNSQNSNDNGNNWNPAAFVLSHTWVSVAYGNLYFVAVSSDGSIARSNDNGANWATPTSFNASTFTSVTYGNGVFVTVSSDGIAVYSSDDGDNWTDAHTISSHAWTSVTYGNGYFVALSTDGFSVYSLNGDTWADSVIPTVNWSPVAYGNGRFTTVDPDTGSMIYSINNGITWSNSYILTDPNFTHIISGNIYAANSLTTTNVFAIYFIGDGSQLSNIQSSSIVQPFANLVVSNALTTTNIFATTANVSILNVSTLETVSQLTAGNIYSANALTTTNVFASRANIAIMNVASNLTVVGAFTSNISNTTFFYDTLTIPYINTLTMNSATVTTGTLIATGITSFANIIVSNLQVTNTFIITATNVQSTNAISITNQGTMTALYVNQNEFPNMTYNVAEFWDHTQLAMVVDGYGNVAVHTGSSPGYAFTVVDGAKIDRLTVTGNMYGVLAGSNAVSASSVSATTLYGTLAGSNAVSASSVSASTLYGTLAGSNIVSSTLILGNTLSNINASNLIFGIIDSSLITGNTLSNINSSNITQPFANLVVSNTLTTTNIIAAGFTSNASNTIFNFSTLTVPFINSTTSNVSGTSNLVGSTFATIINATNNVSVANTLTSTNVYASGAVGYRGPTGTGGTVTQLTNRNTGVTLNRPCGTITLASEAIPAAQLNTFTFTNSFISATDFVAVNHSSGGFLASYLISVTPAAGSATINMRNPNTFTITAAAAVLQFVVIKSINS